MKLGAQIHKKNLQKVILMAGAAAAFTMFVGCSSNKTADTSPVKSSADGKGTAPAADVAKKADVAMVRFINATTTDKSLAFGDAIVFDGTGSRDITAYKQLAAERHDFKLYAKDNKTTTLATNSEGLSAGKHYTVIAYAEKDGTVKLDPIDDDLTPPSAGQAKVRVINLAPGMKDVDLYIAGKKSALISGAGLDHPTDYKEINPADGTLDVRNSISKANSAPVKDLTFEAGKLYTILVFQDKKGKLSVKSVEDQFTAAPNGVS